MNRIDLIVSLTKGYDTVLDIGTDHGLVLKKALDLGYIKKGIASDINKEPLNQAKENLSSYPVSFYLSDGFKNIRKRVLWRRLITVYLPVPVVSIARKFTYGCTGLELNG